MGKLQIERLQLTALYSLLLAAVLTLVIFLFFNWIEKSPLSITHTILLGIVLFLLSFIIIYLSLRHQTKSNIAQVYSLLPDLHSQRTKASDLTELTEKISHIARDKSLEIDILLERENYRREFLGNVAHELKTPLFSIQGYLLTLIEGGVEDDSIRDKYLNRINKSVERLTYIVKDLDLITELESGNMQLERYPFNIVALAQEVFDLLEIKAENNNVKLEFDRIYDAPIKVKGDIEKIEQVLTNLIANAINHSNKENANVTISFVPEGSEIRVTVSDSGQGIKPEHLNRIFERFYRADKSRSRNQGGSGLGLSIVKHILDAHNEKISVESTYGEGATFYFYLEKA